MFFFARNIFFIKDIDINDHNYLSEQNTMKWLEQQDYMPFKIILKQVSMSIYQTYKYRKPEKPEDKFKTLLSLCTFTNCNFGWLIYN